MRVASGLGAGSRASFGLFEGPVLDPELLGLRDRSVARDRLGTMHDVDGIDVELASDPGRLGRRAEAEHADARHEDDGRVGAAHRRAVWLGVAFVVGGVVRPVHGMEIPGALDDRLERSIGRDVEDHRPDLRPQEVVRARCPKCGKAGMLLA